MALYLSLKKPKGDCWEKSNGQEHKVFKIPGFFFPGWQVELLIISLFSDNPNNVKVGIAKQTLGLLPVIVTKKTQTLYSVFFRVIISFVLTKRKKKVFRSYFERHNSDSSRTTKFTQARTLLECSGSRAISMSSHYQITSLWDSFLATLQGQKLTLW